MQTVVLGLGIHFCVGRPPGGALGSGWESSHTTGGAGAGAWSHLSCFLLDPWLRKLDLVSDIGYYDIFYTTILVVLSCEDRLKDTTL